MKEARKMWMEDGRWKAVVGAVYKEQYHIFITSGNRPNDASFFSMRACYERFPPLPTDTLNATADATARYTSKQHVEAEKEKTKQEELRNNGVLVDAEQTKAIEAIADRVEEDADQALYEEILWVYRNIDHSEQTAREKAPSTGSYSMWIWARKNRKMFYEKILPRAITAREKDQAALKDDGGDILNLCRKLEKERDKILSEMQTPFETSQNGALEEPEPE